MCSPEVVASVSGSPEVVAWVSGSAAVHWAAGGGRRRTHGDAPRRAGVLLGWGGAAWRCSAASGGDGRLQAQGGGSAGRTAASCGGLPQAAGRARRAHPAQRRASRSSSPPPSVGWTPASGTSACRRSWHPGGRRALQEGGEGCGAWLPACGSAAQRRQWRPGQEACGGRLRSGGVTKQAAAGGGRAC